MKKWDSAIRIAVMGMAVSLASIRTGWSEEVAFDVALGQPVVLAGQHQTGYLRVAMTGFSLESPEARPPVNLALVLDKSGSMGGEKMERLKEAALMAVDRLRPDDIVAVVAYDSTVQVVMPATRASDKEGIRGAIGRLAANDQTALFAGLCKGIQEVRKFFDDSRVNRIVLFSDGLANVGPSSPAELGELGVSVAREGVSVSTIGLGVDYNEDLMNRLAQSTDGNCFFADSPESLGLAFDREFGDAVSVVAKDVKVRIRCNEGIRPVRVLGRNGEIVGQDVLMDFQQVYSEQLKHVLLEVEYTAPAAGNILPVAKATIAYTNAVSGQQVTFVKTAAVTAVEDQTAVDAATNRDVMMWAVREIGTEQSRLATRLMDEGKRDEARQVLEANSAWYAGNAARLNSPVLEHDATLNQENLSNLDPSQWQTQRKVMRQQQHDVSYSNKLPPAETD